MRTDVLDFDLPPELIAQSPSPHRADSRLLHFRRDIKQIAHRRFTDLPTLLKPGDILVFNDARVTPARFFLRKPTGGRIEGLFLGSQHPGLWSVLLKNLGSTEAGTKLTFENDPSTQLHLLQKRNEGQWLVQVTTPNARADGSARADEGLQDALTFLERVGRMPLPPYIRRDKSQDESPEDRERYQTVYNRVPGSVAAPTAGLHFTPELLAQLSQRGIQKAFVTLHVGIGTFKPVSAETLDAHTMHLERYSLPKTTCDLLNLAKHEGRRIIAVGTTAARVLESQPPGELHPLESAETGIFIQPGYTWKHLGALITNFHLPRSTLIALVAAWTGLEDQRRIYRSAITQGYRFFSYGDSSFLE